MAKCHLCGEEIPQTEVLKHYNTKHPERRQKSKVAKGNEQPKVATTTTIENVSKAPPEKPLEAIKEKGPETLLPAPEIKPAPAPVPPATKPEPEAKVEKKVEKEKGEEITEPAVTPDGIFAYTIHLPADAFTLFNLAKFSGLEKDSDKPFDEWLWDCVVKRFETDYKMELVLAPIKEEVKHG